MTRAEVLDYIGQRYGVLPTSLADADADDLFRILALVNGDRPDG